MPKAPNPLISGGSDLVVSAIPDLACLSLSVNCEIGPTWNGLDRFLLSLVNLVSVVATCVSILLSALVVVLAPDVILLASIPVMRIASAAIIFF